MGAQPEQSIDGIYGARVAIYYCGACKLHFAVPIDAPRWAFDAVGHGRESSLGRLFCPWCSCDADEVDLSTYSSEAYIVPNNGK